MIVKHSDRLLKLADVLENQVAEENFDMAVWGTHYGDHAPEEKNHCGTSACALGWAAMTPEFKADGLKGEWKRTHDKDRGRFLAISYFNGNWTLTDTDAGAEFFGLSGREASDLFLCLDATREEVIDQLRGLAFDREELRA
jgi:hypothetical protein